MIFEALKLLQVCNKAQLMVEEMFILQTIYDYQTNVSELKRDYVKELESNYLSYYSAFSNFYDKGGEFEKETQWRSIIEKLIRDEWIEDYRRNKTAFKLSELRVADKFTNMFIGEKTDEELFEIAKSIYPRNYLSEYNKMLSNFNMSVKEEKEVFEVFKKKVLSGNRKAKWNEFLMITATLYEDAEHNSDSYSTKRFDRYVNTFYENLEQYKQLI